MYSRLRHFELKNTEFETKLFFFIELSKVLEVANFRFLAHFRILTLYPTLCENKTLMWVLEHNDNNQC